MKPKDYQLRSIDTVRAYFEALAEMRAKANKLAADPDMAGVFDFPEAAWKRVSKRGYYRRTNGLGDPMPSFCCKIPTGGGKTYLATRFIDLANALYLKRQFGLVLWVVPSTQIYNQTLAALKDRSHPYRQQLDLASANRTLILEKQRRFSPQDVKENLCVLMLMLPSANRLTKETLRMFRDSAGFDRFFPPDNNHTAHAELLKKIPNLDTFESKGGLWKNQIKTSLGNTLRLLQPLVILDEGHKAYSEGARATIEGFNPSMLIELTATPTKTANVLIDVPGRELDQEGMIKLDLHLLNRGDSDWKSTLLAAVKHREMLEKQAQVHESNTGHYIRPICLIQVERTGRDQRGAGVIHAEDAREYLRTIKGITADQIAVKTSQKDELKEVDEAGGLLDRDCPIRFIITKQALQEGWDCPFAYVLAILTNPASKTALTQLVGRILRQPYAEKTGNHWLDESYVFCFQRRGRDLLQDIRKGFGMEGIGDLAGRITEERGAKPVKGKERRIKPRSKFKKTASSIMLPAFMIEDPVEGWRPVHYEADLLARVPWGEVDASPVGKLKLTTTGDQDVHMRVGLDEGILEGDPEIAAEHLTPDGDFDYGFAASHLLDVMPNPWRGTEIAKKTFEALLKSHERSVVTDNFVYILEELRKQLEQERDRLAEQTFCELLAAGTIRFIVITDDLSFNRLPKSETWHQGDRQANRLDGSQFMLSLFEQMPEDGLNELETKVASFLDEQHQLLYFWHRNASRKGYYVQGWKRHRIYADFVAAAKPLEGNGSPFDRIFVVETKGLHLKNDDTTYKTNVFDVCNAQTESTDWAEFVPAMQDKNVRFEVVHEDEWRNRLTGLLTE